MENTLWIELIGVLVFFVCFGPWIFLFFGILTEKLTRELLLRYTVWIMIHGKGRK